ncbi:DUF3365 domain-containing protein [Bowmanella sp. Y26]|uniref:Tll0287-like domain-containing protein n=1 Tax=Bowmanella yangjiangensis TaxID=2811230 RepID=UPI001BDC4038|nr:DUF3365 domain-containing protein [Bowmanella yangjiangensis]MBT1065476.1 DUF3365 domain-containing protein [Bowmanella yangjiangensis]
MQKLTPRLAVVAMAGMSLMTFQTTAKEAQAFDEAALQAEAKARIGQFAKQLKGTLQQAIQSGGFVKGIEVCRDEAPRIASAYSTDGWMLGRTSHKVRNPANQPDDWEQAQIKMFQQALSEGQAATSLMASELLNGQFRFAKPIVTEGLCLACHGSQLSDEVQVALDSLYPLDMATGFSAGELRGIFSVEKKLP